MNCHDFEKLIALDVEGDLPQEKRGAVAEHMQACRHCQEAAAGLKSSQIMLKDLRNVTADEAVLQEVRRRVLNRLATEPAPRALPMWRFALGAGLVAGLIFALIVLRRVSPNSVPVTAKAPAALETIRHTPAARAPSAVQISKGQDTLESRRPASAAQSCTGARPCGPTQVVAAKRAVTSSPRGTAAERHPEPLMVKLMTGNPNVVIYWLVD